MVYGLWSAEPGPFPGDCTWRAHSGPLTLIWADMTSMGICGTPRQHLSCRTTQSYHKKKARLIASNAFLEGKTWTTWNRYHKSRPRYSIFTISGGLLCTYGSITATWPICQKKLMSGCEFIKRRPRLIASMPFLKLRHEQHVISQKTA